MNRYYTLIRILIVLMFTPYFSSAQLKWTNQDAEFGINDPAIHLYKSVGTFDGSPFIAYYGEFEMKNRWKRFSVDTTLGRRLTPTQFYLRNDRPTLVMNCSFFEFKQNRNVNLIIKEGKTVGFDTMPASRKGKDTLTYAHHFGSAFGVFKRGKMDIAFNYNDSSIIYPLLSQTVILPIIDSSRNISHDHPQLKAMKPWKPFYAFGGGPSLLENGSIHITNNEERKFAGKAIDDKHPRTAIGYTADGKMILLVVQGRMKNIADGATLPQLAQIFISLNCIEAMNLDGGGSSCMLINGKETIKTSDPEGERPVPAVIIIK